MIKTLRITSFLAVALAAVFVVFSVVFGVRSDKDIKGLLGEPDVIEKFNKSAGDKASRNTNQVSPLVQQAGKFALFLNPPEPKTPRQVAGRTTSFKREPSVTPKFKVIVTSYYKDHPELSIAMIDEPGKGRNWVRQSSKVGHLFIEEIKDGVVVVKDSSGTFELKAEQKPHVSLLAGAPPVDAATTSISDQTAGRTESKPSTSVPARSSAYSGGTISRTAKIPRASLPGKTKEKESIMEEVAEKFAQLKSKIESGEYTDQEKAALYSEVIEEIKATWPKDLSKEEKESIGIITKELQKKMDEPTGSGQK